MSSSLEAQEKGIIGKYKEDGATVILKFINEFPAEDVRSAYRWLTVISWKYDGKQNNGMPFDDVNSRMIALEKVFEGSLEHEGFCKHAYSRTGNDLKELVYYIENQDKLKVVPIKLGDLSPVAPTLATISDGSYAPLSRPVFIYVNKASTSRDNAFFVSVKRRRHRAASALTPATSLDARWIAEGPQGRRQPPTASVWTWRWRSASHARAVSDRATIERSTSASRF